MSKERAPEGLQVPCERCGKELMYGGMIVKKHRYKYEWRDYCKWCGKWQRRKEKKDD